MKSSSIYKQIADSKRKKKKLLAVLIDPDKAGKAYLLKLCKLSKERNIACFFVGGSLLTSGDIEETINILKENTKTPVVIFPGNPSQICNKADAILFLSLISGRNAETLIGQQVVAAPYLKKGPLEVLSTGYMLIDSGSQTTASYISNSTPIPADKAEIAVSTALAGELLGMSLIYMDAGSGAKNPVPYNMIEAVKKQIDVPLIVGGGLNTRTKIQNALEAGADMIVVGNAFEKNPEFIDEVFSSLSLFES